MKATFTRLIAAAGLLLFTQPASSHASLVLVDFAASYNRQTPSVFTDNIDPAAVTQATGPLSGSLSHYSTSSAATANYGNLLANSTASGSSDEAQNSNGKAGWEDTLTIQGSGLGTLKLNFTFSGSMTAVDGGAGSIALATYNVNGSVNGNFFTRTGSQHSSAGLIGSAITDFSVTTGTFNFGTAFNFDVSLTGASSYGGQFLAGTGTANASNLHLTLASIEVYDSFNTLVSAPGISSDSGSFSSVPEPTGVLTGLFCLGLAALRRRRIA